MGDAEPQGAAAGGRAGRPIGAPATYVALFMTGAAVMAIEILGARVIGPHFGASLYVWTALIAVTLLALSAGYWVGGAIADRGATSAGFCRIVAAAGALTVLVPIVRSSVVSLSIDLGLRAGTLVAAFVLFFPPLAALGCATPYAVKLHTASLSLVGRSVGRLYAVSTLGSFLGAVATGFLLVPSLAVSRSLALVGATLLLLALVLGARRLGRAELALLVPLVLIGGARAHSARSAPASASAALLGHSESPYGDLRVVDYAGKRALLMDGAIQTAIELETGNSLSVYIYVLLSRVRLCRPDARTALVVGLGGGAIPRELARWGIRTDVVEIDPEIVRIARDRFGYQPQGEESVHVQDGRTFLAAPPRRYDIVILDAYCGERAPLHLLTKEVFSDVRERALAPGGVLAVNYIGFHEGRPTSGAVVLHRTLRSVFPNVVAFPAGLTGPDERIAFWNLIFLASAGPLEPARPSVSMATFPKGELREFHWDGIYPIRDTPGVVLTDDYNPFDTLDDDMRAGSRREAIARVPAEVRELLLLD